MAGVSGVLILFFFFFLGSIQTEVVSSDFNFSHLEYYRETTRVSLFVRKRWLLHQS